MCFFSCQELQIAKMLRINCKNENLRISTPKSRAESWQAEGLPLNDHVFQTSLIPTPEQT
jgi:hypothetical protein